jgi:hypothetical protein
VLGKRTGIFAERLKNICCVHWIYGEYFLEKFAERIQKVIEWIRIIG